MIVSRRTVRFVDRINDMDDDELRAELVTAHTQIDRLQACSFPDAELVVERARREGVDIFNPRALREFVTAFRRRAFS